MQDETWENIKGEWLRKRVDNERPGAWLIDFKRVDPSKPFDPDAPEYDPHQTHRSAEPGSLAVRVGFDERAELLAAAPDVYYVTDHYLNYNAVLVRLSRVTPDVLRDLLGMAHKFLTAHEARRPPSRHPRKPV